jgi:hypothetical protein
MRGRRRWSAVAAGASAAIISGLIAAAPAAGAAAGPLASAQAAGPVSATPASGTPELANTGVTQTVRQLAQCGSYVYAVGSFTTIKRYSTNYTRDNVFRFSATSPYTVDPKWNPGVNGVVNSIAFTKGCSGAYLGGKFTSVHGTAVANLAEVSTSGTGAVVTTFRHNANGQVETLKRHQSHLLVGGYFTSISGSSADRYMASLDSTTGKDDGFVHLAISGNYQFCNGSACASPNPTRVYNQQVSHGGTLELVEGDFTSAGGLPRRQIFMLDLATSPATVTDWTSPEFDGSDPTDYPYYNCGFSEPFYLRAAAWSANDSTVYVATTGYKPYQLPAGSYPRRGLCDAAAAFPATQAPVTHTWIEYTGCDSYYAVAADASAVYVGGHERWYGNPNGCDFAGTGAVADPGMAGLHLDGSLWTNASGGPRYTRSRGKGADDMLVTSAGLWIASDNGLVVGTTFEYSQTCDGVNAHAGICFLHY